MMMAVTVGGQAGAGGLEIGRLLAQQVDGTYVQKQAIRRVARQLGASVEAVVRKELAYHSKLKRLGHRVEVWMAQMGRTWAGDPWGTPVEMAEELLFQGTRKQLPGEITDTAYRTAIFDVAQRYLGKGNVVLTHRAGCLTLNNRHEAVHIGLFAPKDKRVSRVAWRYGLGNSDAEDWVNTMDAARSAWFKALADKDPCDPSVYDISVDVDDLHDDERVARKLAGVAMEIRFGVSPMTQQVMA